MQSNQITVQSATLPASRAIVSAKGKTTGFVRVLNASEGNGTVKELKAKLKDTYPDETGAQRDARLTAHLKSGQPMAVLMAQAQMNDYVSKGMIPNVSKTAVNKAGEETRGTIEFVMPPKAKAVKADEIDLSTMTAAQLEELIAKAAALAASK